MKNEVTHGFIKGRQNYQTYSISGVKREDERELISYLEANFNVVCKSHIDQVAFDLHPDKQSII